MATISARGAQARSGSTRPPSPKCDSSPVLPSPVAATHVPRASLVDVTWGKVTRRQLLALIAVAFLSVVLWETHTVRSLRCLWGTGTAAAWTACDQAVELPRGPGHAGLLATSAVAPIPKSIITANKAHTPHVDQRRKLWLNLNPGYTYTFFTDEECGEFIKREFGLADYQLFALIPHGPIRGDMFRVYYLYTRGGVWADIDIVPRLPLKEWNMGEGVGGIENPRGHGPLWVPGSARPGELNPCMLIAAPGDPVLYAAIQMYRRYRDERVPYKYWPWSIVHIITALRMQGYRVQSPAQERCESLSPVRGCVIGEPGGRDLVSVRGDDYDPRTNAFKPAPMGVAKE